MPEARAPARFVVASALVGLAAARVVWLAWSYYFRGAPRYPLESAVILFVVIGVVVVMLGSRPGTVAGTDRRHVSGAWLPIFLVAAVILYRPALTMGLLSDDYALRAMAQADGLGLGSGWFFRPVPLGIWRLLTGISGSAVPLHLLNVLLHGLNGFLVAVLGVRLGIRREAALVGAALFLTFPAAPETVAWASSLQDALLTTTALGAVLAAGGGPYGARRTALVCVLFALGLGTKETAVAIPALIAICWMTRSRLPAPHMRRLVLALCAVIAAYGAVRLPMGAGATGYFVAPSRYFVKQLLTLAFGSLAIPWRSPTGPAAQWLAFSTIVVLAILFTHALLVWRRADPRFHRAARLALWVLASVAPVYTFFYISPRLEGSRFLYLAECGWALLVADLIRTATDRVPWRGLAFGCVAGAAIVMSTVTLERELAVWTRAADTRDRVLSQAKAAIIDGRCAAARFAGIPDSVDGAYVFRNGFREALGTPVTDAMPAPGCDFTWDGGRFVAAAAP